MENVGLTLVETIDDVYEMKRWLGDNRRDVLAIDLETSGLEWWLPSSRIRLAQIGDANAGWAIPWDRWSGAVHELLGSYEGPMVGHNVAFDWKWMKNFGLELPWRKMNDTMTAAHLTDPTGPQGLKVLATRLVDPTAAAGEKVLSKAMAEQGWNWDTVPIDFPPYWGYAALDCVITARLWGIVEPEMHGRLKEAYELELGARGVCNGMELRGAKIDLKYCYEQRERLEAYCEETAAYCQATWGVSPTSPQQVASVFLRDGIELTERTPKGAFTVNDDVLQTIDHPLAEVVRNVRKAKKVASSYFKNFVNMADAEDRLHPSIRSHEAVTGRMSITAPALQTLPRGPLVRHAFLPNDGEQIVAVDYSNVELRLAAHFSREERMIDAFLNGRDLHTETARGVYGIPDGQDLPPGTRQIAKAVNFTLWYGGGAEAVAAQAKISVDEAKDVLGRYYTAFPRVKPFQLEVERQARMRARTEGVAYVQSPTGRRWTSDEDKVYKLVNYLIQGTAGEELKRALVRLEQAGFSDWALVPVHDEVVFSLPDDAIRDGVIHEIAEVMEERERYAVPLEVEASGPYPTWGTKYMEAA